MCVRACVCVCVRACVRACMRVCVCVCVCVNAIMYYSSDVIGSCCELLCLVVTVLVVLLGFTS